MCTSLSFRANGCFFGRNLDLDKTYGEEVCVMPRHFPLSFRKMGEKPRHYAMVGMATVAEGIPLFYDAVNEHGLAMAGLNFPNNAHFPPIDTKKDNIAPFECIPWILCQCKTVAEAKALLSRINIADMAFSPSLPPTPLHWMLSDKDCDIVVEPMRDKVHIYENLVGVLTNNPPFPYQTPHWEAYKHLTNDSPQKTVQENLPYDDHSLGLGSSGLPGDVSSTSRFVRAAFGRKNALKGETAIENVGQVFHLLDTVSVVKGACKTPHNTVHNTVYSACMDLSKGVYYYTTYQNRRITAVDMQKTELDGNAVRRFPLIAEESIHYQN